MADQNPISGTAVDQLLATITRTGTDTVDQGHSPIPTDIAVTVTMVPTDYIPGHIIETIDTIIGALHDSPHFSTYCSCHDTLHYRSSSYWSSSASSQDHSKSCSHSAYKPSKTTLHKSLSHPSRTPSNSQDKRNPRVMIDDPQMDFYSSDDNSNDSDDDQDHLN